MGHGALEKLMYRMGYKIILADVTVDQIISEEGGSHRDGSRHEYDSALSPDGILRKCSFCGHVKEKRMMR